MSTRQQQQAAAQLVDAVSEENVGRVAALLASGSNPNLPMKVKHEFVIAIRVLVYLWYHEQECRCCTSAGTAYRRVRT